MFANRLDWQTFYYACIRDFKYNIFNKSLFWFFMFFLGGYVSILKNKNRQAFLKKYLAEILFLLHNPSLGVTFLKYASHIIYILY